VTACRLGLGVTACRLGHRLTTTPGRGSSAGWLPSGGYGPSVALAGEEVAAVRAATDLVGLVGDHVALRRQGRRWVGRCPFHAERTPSFSVNQELGVYHCFGCGASGDAITFVREVEHLDFVGAVELLAERAGIELHRDDRPASERSRRRATLLSAMGAAVEWYHDRLLSHDDAGPARHYLRSRGYSSATVRRFRLGWAPDDWDALCRALRLPADVIRDAGLGFVNRAGRQQDFLRARIVFPIFDVAGRPIALGGRILPGAGAGEGASAGGGDGTGGATDGGVDDGPAPSHGSRAPAGPKYKNSPDTDLYSKRRTLYGLNWAKADIVKSGEAVVCEGYTDVIAMFEAGLPRAVATCGTALAEEHFRLLRNFASRIVLAYDADRAGQAAAERFYEWESRHELDIAVAALPVGADPADLGLRDPVALVTAIQEARPFLAFRVDRVLASANLATPEGRARAAEAALSVVAEHPNELVRDQYVMEVAGRCRVSPDRLRPVLERSRRQGRRGPGKASSPQLPVAPDRRSMGPRNQAVPGSSRRRQPAAAGASSNALPTTTSSGGAPAAPGGRVPAPGQSVPAQREGNPARGGPMPAAGDGAPAQRSPTAGDPAQRPLTAGDPARGRDRLELEVLRLAVQRPEDVAQHLESFLFADPVCRAAFLALARSATLHEAVEGTEPAVADLLSRLAVDETEADPAVEVPRLVATTGARRLAQLEAEALLSEERLDELAPLAGWLRLTIDQIRRDPAAAGDATSRLLAWLAERAVEDR
jgi:DNA primase